MNYSGISECDVLNGPGFRVVLFVSGCDHMCHNCHNQKTWDSKYGFEFTKDIEDYLIRCLDKNYIDGITISGGDPLYKDNLNTVFELVNRIKNEYPEKNIWFYTGYTFDFLQNKFYEYRWTPFAIDADEWLTRWEIISMVDVLVDGPYIDSLKDLNLKFRGSSNQRLIDVTKTLKMGEVVAL